MRNSNNINNSNFLITDDATFKQCMDNLGKYKSITFASGMQITIEQLRVLNDRLSGPLNNVNKHLAKIIWNEANLPQGIESKILIGQIKTRFCEDF